MNRSFIVFIAAFSLSACFFTCDSIRGYCESTSNCICTSNECCAPPGKPCEGNDDCCGNGACVVPNQGGARVCTGSTRGDGGQCSSVSLPCFGEGDCCSGRCNAGACICQQELGAACEFDGDCCFALCNRGRCLKNSPDGG